MIKVIATRLGFYGGERKREGATFFVPSKKDVASWMEEVAEKRPTPEGAGPGTDGVGNGADGAGGAGAGAGDGNSGLAGNGEGEGKGGEGKGGKGEGEGNKGEGPEEDSIEKLQADLDAKVVKSNELVASAAEARAALKVNAKAAAITAVELLEAEAQAAYEAVEAAQAALDEALL